MKISSTKEFVKIIFIGLFLAITQVLSAQQVVNGRITDAFDGTPVAGASVFIANTTIGTASDLEGNYSFTVPGRGSFEIVVSHIGYQSLFHKIDVPKDSHQYDVALETIELEEVTISTAKTYKTGDVNLFWQKVLGEKPSKRGIEVINPEKIYFYKSNNILRAFCEEPVEIVNHQTGYHIRYVLQRFEHDYQTGVTEFEGLPSFEELVPRNSREEDQWTKKRQEVYTGSINRFLRAVYMGKVREEGFLLLHKDYLMDGIMSFVAPEEILQVEQSIAKLNIEKDIFLFCFSDPVTDEMIQDIDWRYILNIETKKTEEVNPMMEELLQYKDAWTSPNQDRIQKKQIAQRSAYNENISQRKSSNPVVLELLQSQIIIYPNGTYSGLMTVGEVNKYMGGLSSKVPVEYPERAQNGSYSLMEGSLIPWAYDIELTEENIMAQLEAYPQEKIHLHTDRDIYMAGEKIWFNIYVVDAKTHLNDTDSYYAYVELISPVDTLVNRVMVTRINGMFYGYLPITDITLEGDYTLRAYTRYMENMGDDYFFKKNIRISPSPSLPNREGERGAAGRNAEQKHYTPLLGELEGASFDVSFFPEGGNLPEGVLCKVAFKAINRNGYSEAVTGSLIDESGNEINDVRTYHAGMGAFTYLPVTGKKYFFKCRNENGLEKQFELPQPNPLSYSLAASLQTDKIMIGVQKSDMSSKIPCYLLVHCRGEVIYFSEWDGMPTISLPTENLPPGVIQILLLDKQMNPLSERLVFSSNSASGTVDFLTDKDTYQVRDKIVATLSFPDSLSPSLLERAGEGLSAHFSIAVTDDKDIVVNESTTILSSLLLSSELKGYIENPAYYLQDPVAMDLLMMTHGWRRYNMPEVTKGRLERPKIPFQKFQEISGQVNTINIFYRPNPEPDSEILIIKKGGGFVVTKTGENGSFIAPNLEFSDSTTFYIQVLTAKKRDNIRLTVDKESFPALGFVPQTSLSRFQITETKEKSMNDTFFTKAEQRAKYDEDIWTLHLNEVIITAPRVEKKEPRDEFWLNRSSNYSITRETIEDYKFSRIRSYIQMIPGTSVEEVMGKLIVRFTGMISGNALIYIDGIEDDGTILNLLNPNEIESIDAIKGVNVTILGVRGAAGAVSVTTKRGGDYPKKENQNHVMYKPLGYQKPVEFYSPKYETQEARQSPIPDYRTTIFWKPDVVISDDGEASFEFYTADFPTTYSVVIEGITGDGKIVRQVEKIKVR